MKIYTLATLDNITWLKLKSYYGHKYLRNFNEFFNKFNLISSKCILRNVCIVKANALHLASLKNKALNSIFLFLNR